MIAIGVVGVIACFLPQVQRLLPAGMRPSAVATTVLLIPIFYFLIGKFFPGELLDVLAVTTAEVGVVFCTIVLVTGPIWARPVWGIWWAPGDIRLTSTLVLWLIYVSYLVLRRFSNSAQTQMLAAALAVFGALDVPLVYFSIWFFRTQHPQPVIGGGGSMDPRMLHVLLISWMAFLCFAFLVCWSRFRLELLHREIEEAHAMESLVGSGSGGQGQPAARSESAMNAIKFLFAAYIATWVIHGVYLGSLVRRFGRLRQQLKEVGKGSRSPGVRLPAVAFAPP